MAAPDRSDRTTPPAGDGAASFTTQAADLCAFLDAAPSPYHAVQECARRLDGAGFQQVLEADEWPVGPGRRYVARGGALVAWVVGDDRHPAQGFHLVGAHTDSPNLRVKPHADTGGHGWRQVGVEVYGGALLNSWLDRDLGLSGRVTVRGRHGPEVRLVRDDRPLLRVAQLAIHLDRGVNDKGLVLDPQRHMVPLWGTGPVGVGDLVALLAERADVAPADVLAHDVMLHDLTPATVLGVDRSLLAGARIDNLLSCHAAVDAMLRTVATREEGPRPVPVICLFDHEEVGSATTTGAAGPMLATTLERIASAAGLGRDEWFRALAASICVSADGAHATHPNYAERHEPEHHVAPNAGPVLKANANARYATDAIGAARVRAAAESVGVPLQDFVSRTDMPCGSTIGPVTATRLGIDTVDVGVAQLSMHSARELCGVDDPEWFARLLSAVLHDGPVAPTT
ncbi:MAG: M18 family aminopeptidase [Acidimicrobiales bacterium]|nr:M18 family aminopeptidase [Acidimicrobiales bacterium]